MDKQVKIQRLEAFEDLDLLIRGDAIIIEPSWDFPKQEQLGAYHGKSRVGQLQLLTLRENYILMYRAHKRSISLKDGKIILSEYGLAAESFSQRQPEYAELDKTLMMAGLR